MPRKINTWGRTELVDVTLPNHADSYTVISHKSVMDLSTKALEDAEFTITNENYRATRDGNIASAIYTLNFGSDPELSMMFAWSNSYNKQMRFKCGVGAIHTSNNTSLVCGDMGSWARKHTGSADTETKETIEEQVKLAKMYYEQLVSDKEAMKKITLDKRKQAQLLGMLFAEHDILTTEQASSIKQQMNRATYTSTHPGSLWEFYNFVTLSLQQSHPKTWMEDQRILHWFMSDTFKFDKVEVKEKEVIDPNQVDLEDMIAEVKAEEEFNDFEADAEMQEMKTEETLNVHIEEDNEHVVDKDQIAERIKEDEAIVAELCDKVTDIEAAELIKGQEAIDQQMAQEAAADNTVSDEDIDNTVKGEPDFELDFSPVTDEETDVDSDDVDFDFA